MSSTMRTRAIACLAAIAFSLQILPAWAHQASAEIEQLAGTQQIDRVSTEILSKELELLRLNAKFRLESIRQPRWRQWRQFVYSEGNASCTETAQILRMVTSYPYMHKP